MGVGREYEYISFSADPCHVLYNTYYCVIVRTCLVELRFLWSAAFDFLPSRALTVYALACPRWKKNEQHLSSTRESTTHFNMQILIQWSVGSLPRDKGFLHNCN